jgi:hypothetical protein
MRRYNLEIYFEETGWEDWIHLPEDCVQWWAFVNEVMNFWFP